MGAEKREMSGINQYVQPYNGSGLMDGVFVSRAMMMTACDLSAITKPWEVQSKVWAPPDPRGGKSQCW